MSNSERNVAALPSIAFQTVPRLMDGWPWRQVLGSPWSAWSRSSVSVPSEETKVMRVSERWKAIWSWMFFFTS
jgi:hypothetical protein